MNFTLLPHQKKTVDYCLKHNAVIVALEPGLGKTLVALQVSHVTNSKTLVIVPTYLRLNWIDEIAKFFPNKIVTSFKTNKEIYKVWDSDIVILPYSLVLNDLADSLFEWADMIVLDEAHYIKEMKTQRTEIIHKLVYQNDPKRLLLLTGTPIVNRVYEFYSLMCLCYYLSSVPSKRFTKEFPSYIDFADYFSYRKEYDIWVGGSSRTIATWTGVKNLNELKWYLEGIYIQFKANEVLNLPESIYKDILINEKDDLELMQAFQEMLNNDSVMPKYKAKAALDTVPFTLKYIEDTLPDEKLIVYTDHRDSAKLLAHKLNCVYVTGETLAHKRGQICREFQQGKHQRLVATIGSLYSGVTLVASNNIVYNDLPFVPGILEQSEKRINRLGQTKTCVYHRMLGSPQASQILKLLTDKNKTIKQVTSNAKD